MRRPVQTSHPNSHSAERPEGPTLAPGSRAQVPAGGLLQATGDVAERLRRAGLLGHHLQQAPGPVGLTMRITPGSRSVVQRAIRDDWPDSVPVGNETYGGTDQGETGIIYEPAVNPRASDHHVSIHKAPQSKKKWFEGPGFSVKIHQSRNKYVLAYFFGGSHLVSDTSNAAEDTAKEVEKEAITLGEAFWAGISGSTKSKF